MANFQGPWGAREVRRLDGSAPTYGLNNAFLAYNNTNIIARGDLVLLNANGQIDILVPGTTPPFGVFFGCEYIDPVQQRKTFQPAWRAPSGLNPATIVNCTVIVDDQMIFEVQAGQSSTLPISQADIGSNAQFAGQGVPGTNGQSTAYLSAVAVTATFPWRIVSLSQKIGNDNTAPYNTVEVVLNASQLTIATGV